MTSATKAMTATAPTVQGSFGEKLRASGPVAPARAGAPQRWQKFAPGVSGAEQFAHALPGSGAPQLEQNFPLAGAWQAGQVMGASVGETMAKGSSRWAMGYGATDEGRRTRDEGRRRRGEV
jgi:hypothetical protein